MRRGRVSLASQVYLVTFTTAARRPLFADGHMAMDMCRELVDPRSWQKSELLTWVLMPDHWHGLIQLGEGQCLSATVRGLKANSTRRLRLLRHDPGPVWSSSFHDRAVRREDDIVAIERYIVFNPVRAGLVPTPSRYAFWDSRWVSG